MEEWQREFLRKSREKLLQDTMCNELLLAKLAADDVLSMEDQQQIRSKATPIEQARVLYDTVEKRRGGYAAMAKALADTKQTGACAYFLEGYAYGFFKNASINFLGEIKCLSEYLSEAEMGDINEMIRTEHSLLQCINLYEDLVKEGQAITLVKELKLPKMPFYISRMLLKRVVINKDLFQEDCNDVFVFKGVRSLVQLVSLVRPQRADWSGNQQEKLTCRFIQLQKQQHWDNILEIATAPIHLIKYEEESDSFVLEQTRGASKVIRKYLQLPQVLEVEQNEEHDAIVTEDKFIDYIINGSSSGVCICDSPGMGKTYLLAKLKNKITKQHPTRLVAFIQMSHFMQHIKKQENVLEISSHFFYDAVLNYLSTTPIAKIILNKILKKGETPIELLFDGFDEVQTQDNEFTNEMVMELTTNVSNTRVYVTSRPHKRNELEVSLGVIAYDILPFSKSQQVTFLVTFWKNENKGGDEEKFCIFARRCLETVANNFTTQERNITGIPLTCRLLAQVYARKAKIYSTEDISVVESCKFEDSLPNLYKKYVEKCFAKLEKREGAKLAMKEYHTWMALKVMCPELEERYFQQFLSNHSQTVVDLSFSVEILERRMNGNEETIEFVHRTLAEYFVCQFFAEILDESNVAELCTEEFKIEVIQCLLEKVLLTKEINNEDEQYVFLNPNLAYFLNYCMGKLSVPLTSQILLRLFPKSVAADQLSQMIFGCIRNNYAGIFKTLHFTLLWIDGPMQQKYKSNLFPDGCVQFALKLLNIASIYADFSMVDQLFAFFSECFAFDLKSVCRELPLDIDTPLHFAIERADAQMVQLFADFISLKDRNILLSCVLGSNEDSPKIISQKVEICKILLRKDETLLTEANYTLSESVHVELLKVLIDAGVDSHETKFGESIVHRAAKYMSNEDFHKLCHFLIVEKKMQDLFCPDNSRWKSMLLSIIHQQKNLLAETLEMILNVPGVHLNERDRRGNTPFLLAVKEGQNMYILVVLAIARVNINAVNVYGQNALIVAAEAGNTSILPFLVSLPIHHCHRDNVGNTFLHVLANDLVTAEEYHVVVSLLASAGLDEIFHVKNNRQELPVHAAVKLLEISDETLQLFKTHDVDFNSVDVDGNSLLTLATVGKRSVKFLSALMKFGVDVNARNKNGDTFAHFIALYYSADVYHEILQLLIDKGHVAIFLVKNKIGKTPLHLAIEYIELLPDTLNLIRDRVANQSGFNINCTTADGYSLLMYAAEGRRSFPILKFLIDMGVDLMIQSSNGGDTFAHLIAMHYSAEQYHTIVELLVHNHNGHEKVFQVRNRNGYTPLHYAAIYLEELLEKTLLLLKTNRTGVVDINSTDNEGNTILMTFAIGRHGRHEISPHIPLRLIEPDKPNPNFLIFSSLERNMQQRNTMLKLLIEMGADVMKQDKYGNTFAHIVPKCYSPEEYHDIIQLLIDHNYEQIFAVRNYTRGETPFHCAVSHLNLLDSTLELLNLKVFQPKIADINVTDAFGRSALMYAVRGNRTVKFLTSLINMGADVMKQNMNGDTFAHIIPECYSAKEYHDIIQLLIDHNYEQIFAVRNYTRGETPFHCAVSYLNLLDSTLELLNLKVFQPKIACINMTAADGFNALMCAVLSNKPVKLLKNLINMGVDVMAQDNYGNTFIQYFIKTKYSAKQFHQILDIFDRSNHLSVITIANKKGANALHQALFKIEPVDETLELFKSKILNPDIVDVNATTQYGHSLLVCAALGKRSIKVLQLLIEMNADTSIQAVNGDTFAHLIPFKYSAEQYHDLLEILFENEGAKTFQVVNKYGKTPFHCAVDQLELLPKTVVLINFKVIQTRILDINSLDGLGNSLLCCAAKGKRSITFLKTLLEMRVDVMIKNNKGNTFAHLVPHFYSPEEYHHILELLMESGYEKVFTVVNKDGMTPVHCAIMNLELLEETLQLINSTIFQSNILDVNSTDPNGTSFLVYAVNGKRSIRVLNALIEMGVNVMKEDVDGDTFAHLVPLYYYSEEYHQILKMLLEKGYDEAFKILNAEGLNPLHMAVLELEILDITLEMINSRIFQSNIVNVNSTDEDGNSLLHFAISGKRSVQFLAILIELGVDVSIANEEGQTFVHVIAEYYSNEDYHNLVVLLLEKGHGNVLHTVDNDGMTPLHCAVLQLELLPETLDIFATSSRALETKTDHGLKQTISAQNTFQPVKAIQEHSPGFQDPLSIFMKTAFTTFLGRDRDSQNFTRQRKHAHYLDAVTENGSSVLHWALLGKRSIEFVQRLVNLGADWSALSNHKHSVAHLSASFGLIEHLKYFVELGCDVNGLDNDGDNVLHCVVFDATENIYEMVIFLVEKGADIFHRNKMGQTAYDYALEKGITDSRILNALMCYSGSPTEVKRNKNGDDVVASGATQNTSGKVLYEGKEFDYVFTVDLDGQGSLKLPYNITEDPWFAAQKFIHKNELSQLFLDQVANIIVNNTKGIQLGVPPPSDYADHFKGGNRYVPGSISGTGGFPSGGKTSLLTGGNADITSSAAQVSKASTASLYSHSGQPLFPVNDFIRFATAPNYDALKNKLKEFIQTLGTSAGITIEQIDALLQIGQSQQWRNDTGLLIGTCLQWPDDKVFPVLDLLRLGVLNQEFAKKLNENFPLTSTLAPIFLSKEVPTNQMLFLRLLSNVFGSVTTALMKGRNTLISQVLNNTCKAKANEVAASTLLLNYSIVVCDPNYSKLANVETLTEVLMAAVSMLEFLEDGEAVFRTLVAVGNIICGNPIMSNLFCSLSDDTLVERFIKSGSSPQIQQCASQIKACVIAERMQTPIAMENLDESTSDYSMLATSASNMPTVGASSIINSKGTPKLQTNHTAIPILNSNNYNKTLLDLPTGRITMADIKSVQNSLARTELNLLECIVGIEEDTSHWIVDSVIAGFLFMIADLKCEGCISITPHESAHIFQGETTELIFKADQLQQVDYHNWAEVTRIFVPYNFEEGHWILYVLFPQTREICVLDPVGTFRLPRDHQKFLGDLFNPKFGNDEFQEWRVVYPDAVRSIGRNAMQCGPFVLFYAEAIAKGWSLKEFPDVVMYREHIIASLLRHCQPNIRSAKMCYICTLTIDASEECSFCKRKAHFDCLDEFSAHGRTYRCCK